MFRFANPEYLYLLLLIPLFLLLYIGIRIQKNRALKRYGNLELVKTLMPEFSRFRLSIKYWLLVAAATVLIFVVAGPQFGSKLETVKRQGVELVICLDVSNSMLSEDVAPSRMEKAKQILNRLLDELNNDKIGLVVFAGEAFTQLPITSDYISAKMFINSINPGLVPQQGTAIGAAINQAVRSFTPDETSSKAIIVITDGENHEDDAVGAARNAESKGIKVSVVGVGQTKGTPIPVSSSTNEYRKDKSGTVIITKLDEQMCQEIAQAGAGMYVRADNSNAAMKAVSDQVKKMSKGEVESKVYSEYDEQFQALAWVVLILLIVEFCVLEKKNRLFRHIRLFSPDTPAKALLILFMLGVFGSVVAQKAERSYVRGGNRIYNKAIQDSTDTGKKSLAEAEIEYRKALEVNQRSVPATFNLANTLYKQEKMDQAAEQYQIAITNTQDKAVTASAYHNMGNIAMAGKQYDKAVGAYRQSLKLNPSDNETRYNLALAQKLLQQQQQQEQNQDQEEQKQQDKKDDQQQQQQQENQQDQQKNDQQQQQPPPEEQKDQMSKENAQQILDAFLQDEKATQEKVKKQQMQKQKETERDW